MKLAQKSLLRIKDILKQDKEKISQPLLVQIKSDIFDTLKCYFDIVLQDINLNYFINQQGKYQVDISLTSNRVKKINFF